MFRALPMPLATGFVRLALLATLLPWCAAARADADDTFNTSIGLSALHDSNLFRQVPGKEQADTVTTTEVKQDTWQPTLTAVGSVVAVLGVTLGAEVAGTV